MCKYLYHGNKCCSPAIGSTECVGPDGCHLYSVSDKGDIGDCTFEAWYGLYCPKYKRFFCPGKENCETFEDYMAQFAGLGKRSKP